MIAFIVELLKLLDELLDVLIAKPLSRLIWGPEEWEKWETKPKPPPPPKRLQLGPPVPVSAPPAPFKSVYYDGWKTFRQVRADLEALPELDHEDAERLRLDVIDALKRLDARHEGEGGGLFKGETAPPEVK